MHLFSFSKLFVTCIITITSQWYFLPPAGSPISPTPGQVETLNPCVSKEGTAYYRCAVPVAELPLCSAKGRLSPGDMRAGTWDLGLEWGLKQPPWYGWWVRLVPRLCCDHQNARRPRWRLTATILLLVSGIGFTLGQFCFAYGYMRSSLIRTAVRVS